MATTYGSGCRGGNDVQVRGETIGVFYLSINQTNTSNAAIESSCRLEHL